MHLIAFDVELGEIEHALCTQPGVTEAIVLLRTDEGEPTLVAYVHPPAGVLERGVDAAEGDAVPLGEVPSLCGVRMALPTYMLPSLVVGIDAWPRTSSDKIDRNGLPKPRLRSPSARTRQPSELPVPNHEPAALQAQPTLQTVFELLQTTLEGLAVCASLDVDVPLMEAGMDSLRAIVLMRACSERFGVALPATLLFDHPTARQLAAAIDALDEAAARARPRRAPEGASLSNAASPSEEVHLAGCSMTLPQRGTASVGVAPWPMAACGSDVVGEVPFARWDVSSALGSTSAALVSRRRHGGFASGVQLLDHAAFRISSAEAGAMDPQQRLLLEHGYTALHTASLDRALLPGSATGVFVGMLAFEFAQVLASLLIHDLP